MKSLQAKHLKLARVLQDNHPSKSWPLPNASTKKLVFLYMSYFVLECDNPDYVSIHASISVQAPAIQKGTPKVEG
jgi:hypothetical protein